MCGCQLPNDINATAMESSSSVTAEKCFVVWNETTHHDDDAATLNITAQPRPRRRRRLACPHGWDFDRQPVETSIVTDVSITRIAMRHTNLALSAAAHWPAPISVCLFWTDLVYVKRLLSTVI